MKMSHEARNLQLLFTYFQFSVLSGNFCRKDNFHYLPPSLSIGAAQKQNHRAVQLPRLLKAEKPQELRQTSFTFKYRSPPISKNAQARLVSNIRATNHYIYTSLNTLKAYSISLLR